MDFLKQDTPNPNNRGLNLGVVFIALVLVAMVIIVGVALSQQNQTQPTSGDAPDFALTTFGGDSFDLQQQQGKIVVLNFWGYWCGPCRDEAPLLQSVYEQYQARGVEFIGVTYLAPEIDQTMAFIDEFTITYPNGDDPRSAIAEAYHIQGAPETFIIDQQGNIADFQFGPYTSAEQLTDVLDCLLTYTGEEATTCIEGTEQGAGA
ncbi:MAG: TlpA disulfide reductase family protein [bacterium]|nr:TlpA disulfide reductase family protein [bacterium]